MTDLRRTTQDDPPWFRRASIAVAAVFFTNGAAFSSLLPRLPDIRDEFSLSLAGVGTVLTGVALGGLVGGLLSGALVPRVGSRRTTVVGTVIIAAGLPLVGVVGSAVALVAVLVVLGVVDGIVDIAMNIQAAQLDARVERSIVNGFHAGWSIGTLAGAATGSAAAAAELSLAAHLGMVSIVLVGVCVFAGPSLMATDDPPEPASEDGPRRRDVFAALAGLALLLAVVEGAPGEWAALFQTDVHGLSDSAAGLGYAMVTAGMVAGRLLGDRATDRFGGMRLLRGATVLAAASILVIATSPVPAVAFVGFLSAGLGASVLFPALYLAAARRANVSAGVGLAVMTTGARVGFLTAPIVIGTISDATSLRVGLGAVVLVAAVLSLPLSTRLHR